jgi:hypothetical protein
MHRDELVSASTRHSPGVRCCTTELSLTCKVHNAAHAWLPVCTHSMSVNTYTQMCSHAAALLSRISTCGVEPCIC